MCCVVSPGFETRKFPSCHQRWGVEKEPTWVTWAFRVWQIQLLVVVPIALCVWISQNLENCYPKNHTQDFKNRLWSPFTFFPWSGQFILVVPLRSDPQLLGWWTGRLAKLHWSWLTSAWRSDELKKAGEQLARVESWNEANPMDNAELPFVFTWQ